MTTKTEISMDLARPGILPRIYAVQGEADCRTVAFSLYENGGAWEGPKNPQATVGFRRADGSGGYVGADGSGNAAVLAYNNTVTLMLTGEICTAPGPVMLTVEVTDGASVLATWPLLVEVLPNAGLQTLDGAVQRGPWAPNRQIFTTETGAAVALEGYCDVDLTGLARLDFGNAQGAEIPVTQALTGETLAKLAAGDEIRALRVKLPDADGVPVWAVLPSRFDVDGGCLYSGVLGSPSGETYVSMNLDVTAEEARLKYCPAMADPETLAEAVMDAMPKPSAIHVDRTPDMTTMTVSMADGGRSVLVIEYGDDGEPGKISVDGAEIVLTFTEQAG